MSANSQDNGTDDFVSITEMGRELEKGLSEIVSISNISTAKRARFLFESQNNNKKKYIFVYLLTLSFLIWLNKKNKAVKVRYP